MKIKVGILGATGVIGQHYISLLENHPWFEVHYLAASDQSAGKNYGEAVARKWKLDTIPRERIQKLQVHSLTDIASALLHADLLFSALPKDASEQYEEKYAQEGFGIISNSSAHRLTPDVPLLIPEINSDHLTIIDSQQKKRGWKKGFIVVKPNCSIQSFMIPLDPLHRRFGVDKISVTTFQAISGAGYPGVASQDILDNIIPFIEGEEEKSEKEPLKIWGTVNPDCISLNEKIAISAHCNRVPVLHGHMACLSVQFSQKPTIDEILNIWNTTAPDIQELNLPSAPKKTLRYLQFPDRPQPRLDRDYANGMGVSVGRLRPCPLMHIRFVGLSHNTLRGAAGGGILNAELLYAKGYIK